MKKIMAILFLAVAVSATAGTYKSKILAEIPAKNLETVAHLGLSQVRRLIKENYSFHDREVMKENFLAQADSLFRRALPKIINKGVNEVHAEQLCRRQLRQSFLIIGTHLNGGAVIEREGDKTVVSFSGKVFPSVRKDGKEAVGQMLTVLNSFGWEDSPSFPETIQRCSGGKLSLEQSRIVARALLR